MTLQDLVSRIRLLDDLPTPALILDGAALERNIARMAAHAREARISLRPHAKTHKSAHIAKLQIEAGAIGIACATVKEAAELAAADIPDLLLTTPVMGRARFADIAEINRVRGLSVVVDHLDQVEGLSAHVLANDRPVSVAIDVDVGHGRTGVTNVDHAVALARAIEANPCMQYIGIQGFAGHAQHLAEPSERAVVTAQAADRMRETVQALTEAGLAPRVISGSGTGTYRQDAAGPYNELQVGSYVFMDADYARILDEGGQMPPFEHSLFVLATVVSINRPGEVTVDAGVKALATNGPPPSLFPNLSGEVSYRFAGDEHGLLSFSSGVGLPPLGAKVLIGATHCDPTVNLHAHYHVLKDGRFLRWPILGRYNN